jgi:hypothetical protein
MKLVEVSKTPIDGIEYPLDAVVGATGFAAMTGSFE